jgi:O-Antigen ligase
MSTIAISRAGSLRRRSSGAWRRLRAPSIGLALLVGAAAASAAIGRAFVGGDALLAVAGCLLPLAVWSLSRPALLLVLLGASLPLLQSVTGGRLGYQISISDLLLVLLSTAIVFRAATTGSAPEVRALRPIATPVLVYCTIMVLLLPSHFGVENVVQTGQRYELFLAPLVVGAFAALSKQHLPLLQAYVLSTTALAVVWPFDSFELQKNPVGQLTANAILLLVGFRALHRLWPCLLVLVPGLLLTQSRGAIVAAAIGITVIVLMRGLPARQMAIRIAPVLIAAGLTFAVIPAAAQERLTTFSAGTATKAEYSIWYRDQYAADARRIIDANSWTGVGVGNYRAANAASFVPVDDPHNVLLLQAAEGGYVLAVGFILVIVGSFLALVRMRSIELAPVAAGVLLSTAAHGLVDVYWVRGTPVLSWLLVGMACGLYATRERGEAPP